MSGPWRYSDLLVERSREQVRLAVEAGRLYRPTRGVYGDHRDVDGSAMERIRATLLRLPDEVVVGYETGAALFGFGPRTRDIHVVVPAVIAKPRIEGVVAHLAVLPVREPRTVAGVRCASPERCAVDIARSARRMDAIATLDAALRVQAVGVADLRTELSRHARLRGVCQARQLVGLADGRAECRQESQLRLVLCDGGLPAPEPQVWVLDDGGWGRYRLDLAYRRAKVGIEYDGQSHLDRERMRNDRVRGNWLAANGWTMRYFTDADLYHRPAHIVDVVRAALR